MSSPAEIWVGQKYARRARSRPVAGVRSRHGVVRDDTPRRDPTIWATGSPVRSPKQTTIHGRSGPRGPTPKWNGDVNRSIEAHLANDELDSPPGERSLEDHPGDLGLARDEGRLPGAEPGTRTRRQLPFTCALVPRWHALVPDRWRETGASWGADADGWIATVAGIGEGDVLTVPDGGLTDAFGNRSEVTREFVVGNVDDVEWPENMETGSRDPPGLFGIGPFPT